MSNLPLEMVTVDCRDPGALGGWWAEAVGGEFTAVAPGEFAMVLRAAGPRLGFQRVDDPTPGKNKLHLDFHAEDREAEVARLIGLGAVELGRNSFGPDLSWVVLGDPEGNAFCVA